MNSLITRIRRRLESVDTVIECQTCGTKLDEEVQTCPECGSTEIIRYDLE